MRRLSTRSAIRFDVLDAYAYLHHRSPRSETPVLRLLEWSEEGHRYRAELRDVEGRRVWFVAIDDGIAREVFEKSWADANLGDLRRRLVRAVEG